MLIARCTIQAMGEELAGQDGGSRKSVRRGSCINVQCRIFVTLCPSRAKLDTAINSLSASHAYLKTLYKETLGLFAGLYNECNFVFV